MVPSRKLWVAVSFLLYGIIGCERGSVDREIASSSAPSVLLITLDTTRADRIGCYGHDPAQTPRLDQLSASGVRFANAFCQVPLTLPSHASLLTGTFPATNGLRINGAAALGDEPDTLAEFFKSRGYRTGAFVSAAVLDAAFQLDQGFDAYDDETARSNDAETHDGERRGDKTCDRALAWLGSDARSPFFAWVHFFDPHDPYTPPEPFRRRTADAYDGEIAFVDAQVGRLLDWLASSGRRDNTLVVIAGDHGESFEEHGEIRHGLYIYNTTMHVPLIISSPSLLATPRVIEADVRLVDVFPTIVDLLEMQAPPGLEGESLAYACRTGEAPSLPIYGESEYPRMGYGWAPLRFLAEGPWKYIHAPTPELYDRVNDPGETHNLASGNPTDVTRLRRQLLNMVERMQPRSTTTVASDPELMKRLESLGYVGGTGVASNDADIANLRDPKDMMEVYRTHMKAVAALQTQHFGDVVAMMEPLVQASPESDEFHATLGKAYLGVGRYADAQSAFKASLRRVPNHAERLCGLGDALAGLGKGEDAILCYRQAVAVAPNYGQAHSRLGTAYASRRRFKLANEQFARFVELNPNSPNALSNQGNVLLPLGRNEEAAALLSKALDIDPNYVPAHRSLWRALLALQKPAETIAALRAAHQAIPQDRSITLRLAWLLATARQDPLRHPEDAVRLATEVRDSSGANAEVLDVLAAAFAAKGDFDGAIQTAAEGLSIADAQGNGVLADRIQARLHLYERHQPFRQ